MVIFAVIGLMVSVAFSLLSKLEPLPLSVTGLWYKRYYNESGRLTLEGGYHQMTLDNVEKNEFIIQNTQGLGGPLTGSECKVRINSKNILYQIPNNTTDILYQLPSETNRRYIYDEWEDSNPKFKPENFYLLNEAYSITLEKSILSSKEFEDSQNDERRKKEVEASITQKTHPGPEESFHNAFRQSAISDSEEIIQEKQKNNRKLLTTIQEDSDEADLDLADNLQKLTEADVKNWLEAFNKKLRRTSSRNYRDQLILSIERTDFKNLESAGWGEFIFENNEGKVTDVNPESKWPATFLQKKILENHYDCRDTFIHRTELKEETGIWQNDESLDQKLVSIGGEAIIFEEEIEDVKFVARVQVFDPLVFTNDDELIYDVFYSKDFMAAKDKFGKDKSVIPRHKNVIQHFCNVEIYAPGDDERSDCLGWITLMPKADNDLRKSLKSQRLTLDQRKKIAIDLKRANDYLNDIGITHCDLKPENVLMKNGVPLITDFGLVMETSNRISYRQLGYSRKGSRYRDSKYLHAGSAGFASGDQLIQNYSNLNYALFVLILCEWNTAWSLLFKPHEDGEKEKIEKELESFNAGWLKNTEYSPEIEQIQQLTGTITLRNASSNFNLDDENLTKSCAMTELKQRMTRAFNYDFHNLTNIVLNAKDSNLCVPISVSVLLRWAIKNDLKVEDYRMKRYFTVERILTLLTMTIYPRSLAGMNLNPKNKEKEFQQSEIELLLKSIKNETYLHRSGWDIIQNDGYWAKGTFDFKQVLLHNTFVPTRPLTVTGAYLKQDGELIFHQMILDRVEYDEYILQNTLISSELASSERLPLLRIDRQKRYYGIFDMFNSGVVNRPNGEFLLLTNEYTNSMNKEEWYLLPEAYSITLTP